MTYETATIENLKRALASLEREAELKRQELKSLLLNDESRRCTVEIFWNSVLNNYTTRFSHDGKTLHTFSTKKSTRSLASVGIARANGLRPRVSWKDVDAGHVWTADAVIHDWYWEKYFAAHAATPAKVIDFNLFRSVLGK